MNGIPRSRARVAASWISNRIHGRGVRAVWLVSKRTYAEESTIARERNSRSSIACCRAVLSQSSPAVRASDLKRLVANAEKTRDERDSPLTRQSRGLVDLEPNPRTRRPRGVAGEQEDVR